MPLSTRFVLWTFCAWMLSLTSPVFARDASDSLLVATPQDNSVYSQLPFSLGSFEGFDVELLGSAGHLIHRDVEFVPARSAAQGLEMLQSGRVDAVIGIPTAMAVQTHEQGALLLPYRQENLYAFVQDRALYRKTADLSEAVLALPEFSPALAYGRSRGWNLLETRNYAEAFQLLEEGTAQAVLAAPGVARQFLLSGDTMKYRQLAQCVFSTEIALAVSSDFVDRQALARALESLGNLGQTDRLETAWGIGAPLTQALPSHRILIGYGLLMFFAALIILIRGIPERNRHHWAGINTQPAFPGRHM